MCSIKRTTFAFQDVLHNSDPHKFLFHASNIGTVENIYWNRFNSAICTGTSYMQVNCMQGRLYSTILVLYIRKFNNDVVY